MAPKPLLSTQLFCCLPAVAGILYLRKPANFLALIAEGKAPMAGLDASHDFEHSIAKHAELERLTVAQPSELDLRRLKRLLHEQIGKFKDLIYSDVPRARQALRKPLDGPIGL